ncbi:ATP-binding protein [Streptomyces sp. NPDC026665]|uniref:ATP-binding protein n=1 Tax=Streptomyces sp. NPDC026665 TaxID=3154798 RepID=UPI0033F5B75D
MASEPRDVLFYALILALLALAVVLSVWWRRILVRLRSRLAARESELHAREEELDHIVKIRLPEILELSGAHFSTGPLLATPSLEGTAYGRNLQHVLETLHRSEEVARQRANEAAKAALKTSMRTIQGLAHEQQQAISRMQEIHDDHHVLQGLLEIDHMNAQLGRRTQAIAILCGAWPGRQRASAPLIDVIRGATSRIRDYRRVKTQAHVDYAVVSSVVEPVVLAVAELLDNAARHSEPNTTVQVSVLPAHNGVSIVIDDAGVGLHPRDIQRSVRLLSPDESPDVTRLGNPPQFGFALIGVLATRYGFSVSVDTRSPYGGVRAIVYLPANLLTSIGSEDGRPAHVAEGYAHAASAQAPFPQASEFPVVPNHIGHSASLLPQRRRRQPVQGTSPGMGLLPGTSAPMRSAESAATLMGAFARGTRAGRDYTSDMEGHLEA